MADDAYAASLRAVNPYYEDALRDECEAHRIAAGAADRFRDVLCEVLDLNENPGDVALVARIREAHGKSGPEPRRWRDFITGATAHLERSGLSFKADRALSADHNESERDRPMSADRDHIWTDDHPTCLRCSATPEQMSADVRQNGHPTCSDQTNEGEG